jgi:cysteine desulfurase
VNTPRTTYLDYNATTPVKPAVAAVVARTLETVGNPSSVHAAGRAVRIVIENAREQVARLVGAAESDVVFTSGGTEANNLCLRAMKASGRQLFVSAVEHPSVLATAEALGAVILPVDENGIVQPDVLANVLAAEAVGEGQPALVSIMTANNETGVVQPLQSLVPVAHENGALFHTDAVQAVGKISFDMNVLNVDLATVSAHKMGGMAGSGALVVRPTTGKMQGILTGGGQEKGLRPGTENIAGIAGFGQAAVLAFEDLAAAERITALRNDLEQQLLGQLPGVRVFGHLAERTGNTSCLVMPGVESEVQVMSMDLEGIAVSAGSACSSGKVAASPVLLAMGADEKTAASALRVSLGWATEKQDIEHFVRAWTALYQRLGRNEKELTAA